MIHPVPTDHHPTVTVVGYVRPTLGERPGGADGAILGYATRHDLAMKRIHRDDPAESGRPGFLAVLDDLREGRATGVLIASAEHLSSVPQVEEALMQLVKDAGGRLYLADAEPPPPGRQFGDDPGAPAPSGR